MAFMAYLILQGGLVKVLESQASDWKQQHKQTTTNSSLAESICTLLNLTLDWNSNPDLCRIYGGCSGVAGVGVCVVSVKGRGSGGCAPGIFFFVLLPKPWGFCKISCARKITTQENPTPDERLKTFFKKSCVWLKDRQRTNWKTVTCVSERRVN